MDTPGGRQRPLRTGKKSGRKVVTSDNCLALTQREKRKQLKPKTGKA
jgi:hypothetical protein